jgi:hypothetical protein
VWTGRLPPASATVGAQFWVEASPARLTAGWVFLAALLAAGAFDGGRPLDWPRLVLLWLLVDPLWGTLWRMAGGRNHLLPLRTAATVEGTLRLPYLQPNSPAAQLLGLDERHSFPYIMRVAVPALAVALVVATVLGVPALLGTLAVLLAAVGGWILRHTLTLPPLLFHAVVLVGLPWLLTLWEMDAGPGSAGWPAALAVGALWTLHGWGEARVATWGRDRLALLLLAAAEIGLGLVFVINRTPIWLPVLGALVLPVWLRWFQFGRASAADNASATGNASAAGTGSQMEGGLALWWLAALLVSALALGWS